MVKLFQFVAKCVVIGYLWTVYMGTRQNNIPDTDLAVLCPHVHHGLSQILFLLGDSTWSNKL